ncbi:MAG: hypothetical protein PHX54_13675 [Lentimicrobiaceae bacterium]|nr:hypothetical protein [Lentimicrobiaceae bacterium]
MQISVDISYYPLNETYKKPIKAFIADLSQNKNIKVYTNKLSTQVFGEMDEVMTSITRCMKDAFELPHSVFVLKIINANLNPEL